MAAPTRTPRSDWIAAGLKALAAGGPDAVRIEVLAQELGVTRGGFYWHFENRRALLDEMLDSWERVLIDEAIARVEEAGGDARARLRRLFSLAIAGGAELLRIENAVRDWARREAAVAERLRRVDSRRREYMRWLFGGFGRAEADPGAGCWVVMWVFAPNALVAADQGARSRGDVVGLVLARLRA